MKNRFIANDTARLFGIGRFHEELTIKVVGGVRLNSIHEIDIEHADLDSMIEVKAHSSSQPPSIYVGQLEKHLDRRGFPFTHCCYALWSYHNPRQNRLGNLKIGTTEKLYQELALRTRMLSFLDARIIEAAMHKRGISGQWHDGDYRTAQVRINTSWLRELALGPADMLQKLGLKRRSFFVQQGSVQTVFEGFPLRFDYTAVLPRSAAGFAWPIHQRVSPRAPQPMVVAR